MYNKILKWFGVAIASVVFGIILFYIQFIVGFANKGCEDQMLTNTKCSLYSWGSFALSILNFPFLVASLISTYFRKIFAVPPGPPFTTLNIASQWILYIVFFILWILVGFGIFRLCQKRKKNNPNNL